MTLLLSAELLPYILTSLSEPSIEYETQLLQQYVRQKQKQNKAPVQFRMETKAVFFLFYSNMM